MHLTDEEIDQYAMGRTPALELRAVEEHLLTCERCREGIEWTALLVDALRDAQTFRLAQPD
jgi:anti-sigma factor RsiW